VSWLFAPVILPGARQNLSGVRSIGGRPNEPANKERPDEIPSILLGPCHDLAGCRLVDAQDKKIEEKRDKSRKMAAQTLKELYKLQPTAQAATQTAAGYAVFDNMGMNLLLLSKARGSGIAVNSRNQQETFMKMVSVGGGLGVGVKSYRVIFVLEKRKCAGKLHRIELVRFSAGGRGGQGWQIRRSVFWRARGCPGRLGLPDYQEWSRPSADPTGYKIL
jgi:hypothetical protein